MLYIIGPTKSGKTTFSRHISEMSGLEFYSTSEFIREIYGPEYNNVEHMTDTAIRMYKSYPNIVIDRIMSKKTNGIKIIEGIRNARDFIHVFNEEEDYVAFLLKSRVCSVLEMQIDLIYRYCSLRVSAGFMKGAQMIDVYEYNPWSIDEIKEAANRTYNFNLGNFKKENHQ